MRLKKLRLTVGVALIVFILVAGNTIAFGLLSDKLLANKDELQSDLRIVLKNTTPTNQTSSSSTIPVALPVPVTPPKSNVSPAPVTPPAKPVVVQKIKTRAS